LCRGLNASPRNLAPAVSRGPRVRTGAPPVAAATLRSVAVAGAAASRPVHPQTTLGVVTPARIIDGGRRRRRRAGRAILNLSRARATPAAAEDEKCSHSTLMGRLRKRKQLERSIMRPGDGFIELADPAETLDKLPGETAFRGTPEGFPRTIGDLPGTPEGLRGTPRGLLRTLDGVQ